MPTIIPTRQQVEDYLESLEELLYTSLSSATPDLPNVREAIHRLWEDILRHSPQNLPNLPEIHIPGLGAFEIPPPPPVPPPPPPREFMEKSVGWIGDHKWLTASVVVGIVGAGIYAGYGPLRYKHAMKHRKAKAAAAAATASASTERRQIVVVLGGDSPLGIPLVLDLEQKGYIVITSVSNPESVPVIESQSHGYVRALVLDPTEPETVPYFLRSLSSTMSRRFPITSAGDPYTLPSHHAYIHSILCLLTLPSPQTTPEPAPFEHLTLREDYFGYLQASHIVPLQVIQALLPLLRNSHAQARDAISNNLGRKSIVVCLPATDARVGLAFSSARAMSAAATLRGIEVLRREIRAASFSNSSDSMKNIRVVVVDVGAVGGGISGEDSLGGSLSEWSQSEQLAYGDAFSSLVQRQYRRGPARKPTSVNVFVDTLVKIVRDGRGSPRSVYDIGLGLAKIREWVRGDRVVVGAGARTYALASHLPSIILEALLSLPHFLLSIRNAMLPIPPRVILPEPYGIPPDSQTTAKSAPTLTSEDSLSEDDHHSSDVGSEADVESNEGSGVGVGESWISVNEHSPVRS